MTDDDGAEGAIAGPGTRVGWLVAQERAAWLALVGMMIRLPAALDAQLQRDAGLSHFEYMVLVGLSEAPGRTLRMSELAQLTSGSLSRLSHVVTRLERRGWARRAPCPGDGRSTNAVLTDAGFAALAAAAPGHVAMVRSLVMDALTDEELGQLHRIGREILERVDRAGVPPPSEPGGAPALTDPGRRARRTAAARPRFR